MLRPGFLCIRATLTQHDSVIFQDNDFEVFVCPDGTSHYYKEFEMNALNTTWSLCLNKPYLNGGYENSSRVFGKNGYRWLFLLKDQTKNPISPALTT
eukprot:m.87102 g.87102  ORF g.87102 m.87102 type:complete len:97 (+) comp14492_c1_seq2:667-957(+)